MKLYKVRRNSLEIEVVEVTRKNDKSLWALDHRNRERRESRSTNWYNHFDSFEEAKEHIVNREARRLQGAKDAVIRYESEYQKALLISQP